MIYFVSRSGKYIFRVTNLQIVFISALLTTYCIDSRTFRANAP